MPLVVRGDQKPHISIAGRFWAVRYRAVGGVFLTFQQACEAARYYARDRV